MWGCSSAGRAPALQAGGHRFDPVHLHHISSAEVQKRGRAEGKTFELLTIVLVYFPPMRREMFFDNRRKEVRVKIVRAYGGCLGIRERRRTQQAAKSYGDLRARVDP